jgi:hypothetical protein
MNELIMGAISSLGGSLLGGVAAYFSKKEEGKQLIREKELEIQAMRYNHAHEAQMASLGNIAKLEQLAAEQKSTIIAGEYEGLMASIEADKATYSIGTNSKLMLWVDFIRGTMRPLLTGALMVYLGLAVVYITLTYKVELDKQQVYDLLYMIIICLVTGANVALTWWFGSRNPSKVGG